MHDLYEGAVPHELKLFLTHCIQSKYFTLQELNNRIGLFDFSSDKPSSIGYTDSEVKIKQSAGQMMSLIHALPFLVCDKIPRNEPYWDFFLVMIKICSIAIAPTISYDTIAYLKILINEKLSSFLTFYPHSTIIPKLHYMVHYPAQIEALGPLIYSWTMRQESKNGFVKRSSRRGNYKNVVQTATCKHQFWQCYNLQTVKSFLIPMPEVSPKSYHKTLQMEADYLVEEITKHIPDGRDLEIEHPKWVKVQSSCVRQGGFMLLKYDLMQPEFGKVIDIAVVQGVIFISFEIFTVSTLIHTLMLLL